MGGSISGLTATGLVLLDNNADATGIAANATQFTMHTALASGATYDITVGTQPYGISLACTPSSGSGAVSGNVATVAISCANVTPTQKAIASYFYSALGVAVDIHGNVFVADSGNNEIKEIPYADGSYGTPEIVGSGFLLPAAVAVDAQGNVFVADTGNYAVKKIPYSNGSYGTPMTLASGLGTPMVRR